jgi:cell division protein FtsW
MQRNVAYLLLIVMLGLIALGIVMLTSTSAVLATKTSAASADAAQDPSIDTTQAVAADSARDMTNVYSNLRKQLVWLAVGGIMCVVLSRYDYQKLLKHSPYIVGVACVLLALCLVPHIGHKANGSARWLKIAGWTYQPSEFAKVALILFLSWWMGKYQRRAGELMKGFVYPVLCVSPIILLMIIQQDFGTTAIMGAILLSILILAGSRMIYVLPASVIGIAGMALISFLKPERHARIMAFLHSGATTDPALLQKIYQQKQALIALGSGGLWGLGLGNSRQKMYWLPEVNTDFVFPIIGEELGLFVALAVVLGFLVLMLCSGWITIHAPDPAGVLLGTGLTLMIALQALMNLAVVTSLMPCKGIPLPFISYGGSNLLTCLAAIGILFNMHRQGIYQPQSAPALTPMSYSVRM